MNTITLSEQDLQTRLALQKERTKAAGSRYVLDEDNLTKSDLAKAFLMGYESGKTDQLAELLREARTSEGKHE